MKLLEVLFRKQIEGKAQKLLKELALDEYIDKNLFTDTTNGLELQMRGKKFVKYLAACFHEVVKDAPNYLTMDLICSGYEPLNVVIQKKSKLSPHERAEKLEKENQILREENEDLRKKLYGPC